VGRERSPAEINTDLRLRLTKPGLEQGIPSETLEKEITISSRCTYMQSKLCMYGESSGSTKPFELTAMSVML
jgi:hypothetical protein